MQPSKTALLYSRGEASPAANPPLLSQGHRNSRNSNLGSCLRRESAAGHPQVAAEALCDYSPRVEHELRSHTLGTVHPAAEPLDNAYEPFADVPYERNVIRSGDHINAAAKLFHHVALPWFAWLDPKRPIGADFDANSH